jgi:hypothetical protein
MADLQVAMVEMRIDLAPQYPWAPTTAHLVPLVPLELSDTQPVPPPPLPAPRYVPKALRGTRNKIIEKKSKRKEYDELDGSI